MNWELLKTGYCPKCEGMLLDKGVLECEDCDFNIKKAKYFDLIKGKESKAYKKKKQLWQSIKNYKAKKKEKEKSAKEIAQKERMFNLKRMFEKGEITKNEYELKIK